MVRTVAGPPQAAAWIRDRQPPGRPIDAADEARELLPCVRPGLSGRSTLRVLSPRDTPANAYRGRLNAART